MWQGWRVPRPRSSAMSSTTAPGRSPRPRASGSSPRSRSWATGPDRVAQAMASRRTDLIGLIVPGRPAALLRGDGARRRTGRRRAREDGARRQLRLPRRARGPLPAGLPRHAGLRADPDQPGPQRARGRRDRRLGRPGRAAAPAPRGHRRRRGRDRRHRRRPARHPPPAGTRPRLRGLPRRHRVHPGVGDPVTDHVEGWRRAMQEAGRPTEGRLFQAPYNRYDAYQVALELLAGPGPAPGDLLRHRRPGDRRAAGRPRAATSTSPASWPWPASTTSRRRRSPTRR